MEGAGMFPGKTLQQGVGRLGLWNRTVGDVHEDCAISKHGGRQGNQLRTFCKL